MKRLAAAVLASCLFAGPAGAIFAMAPADRIDEVPVARLLANLEANAQKLSPAERWRAIGRMHLLAYLRKAVALPVYRARPDTVAEGAIESCAVLDAQAVGFGDRSDFPPTKPGERCEVRSYSLAPRAEAPGDVKAPRLPMDSNLAAAIRAYEKARKLEPRNLRTRVALAFALDRGGRAVDALAELRFTARTGLRQLPAPSKDGMAMSDWELHVVLSEAQAHLALVARAAADRALADELKRRLKLAPPAMAVTPILVPLGEATAFEALVDLASPVRFDFSGQGEFQRAGWLTADAAWLVWDPNHTGRITSGFQLFGSVTWVASWDNGFRALGALDDNGDGMLSGHELVGLSLWRDVNGDGRSAPGEVRPVTTHGIVSLAYAHERVNDQHWVSPTGVTFADGRVRPSYDWMVRTTMTVADSQD